MLAQKRRKLEDSQPKPVSSLNRGQAMDIEMERYLAQLFQSWSKTKILDVKDALDAR